MIAFETESNAEDEDSKPEEPVSSKPTTSNQSSDDVIQSATAALDAARAALKRTQAQSPSRPDPTRLFTYKDAQREAQRQTNDEMRATLMDSLGRYGASGEWDPSSSPSSSVDAQTGSSSGAASSSANGEQPAWTQGILERREADMQPPQPQLQPQTAEAPRAAKPVQDRVLSQLTMQFETAAEAQRAKTAVLPPLQSVLELTSAAAPPSRNMEEMTTAVSSAGRQLEDGVGVLSDGTKYERTTTEEFGADGYWLRQTVMRGVSAQGKVEWEERWWEASDWAGMREMGAEKSGCAADGSAWRETWREAIAFDSTTGEPIVERSAHKWAQDAKNDSWEEKWGEHYTANGAANKYADKWGKDGPNVWHERWGEDYDGSGGCVKYTDKWAERLVEGGGNEQWGENWVEDFGGGAGGKKGETWSVDGSGHRYQRWWGEEHFGNGWVRRFGNSTTGEHWDQSEEMDTYYNPIPHFTYQMALDHSPTLQNVPVLPRGDLDDFEGGGASSL